MKNLHIIAIALLLSSCAVTKQGLVYESIKTLGKKGLEKVLNLSEFELEKDTVEIKGNYSNTILVKRLGKGFTTALTNEGFIITKTRRFVASVSWQPALNDSLLENTTIHFYYYKNK